ncbi:MAG: type III-B CRISPR module RAMP protein Cmr6 [Alphaproteobacteria bacterium]|nr:type III-B CRISPR module RAMP protein Cmr6 [Alphaproteobacteria bacterium]
MPTYRDWPLPRSTSDLLGRRPSNEDNLGLWIDKLLPRLRDPGDVKQDWSFKGEHREGILGSLARRWRSEVADVALARQRASLEAMRPGWHVATLRAAVSTRLLVDFGRSNAVESAVSLHHVYGVPRIPGSALKGLVKGWSELQKQSAETPQQREEAATLLDHLGRDAKHELGARASDILFHDALPEGGRFALEGDIVNPHAGPYYRGEEPPADWLSPVPHTFLTVVDTTFVIAIQTKTQALADSAIKALGEGLYELGIGARTSLGYGRLEVVGE